MTAEKIRAALHRAWDGRRRSGDTPPVTAGEVDAVLFTSRRSWSGRYGYDETEVDDFLDRVADTIAEQERELSLLRSLRDTVRDIYTDDEVPA